MPCASTMQMAWLIASTVFSHSRFADDSSSTSRAFWSAMAPWASAAATSESSLDRKSTRLNSSHGYISYAVFCLKKKKNKLTPNWGGIIFYYRIISYMHQFFLIDGYTHGCF